MTDPTKDHHRVTPQGRALGAQLLQLCEPTVASLAADGIPDERCKSCAFRAGTVPNGCPQTQADAFKAVIEDVAFRCHQADRNLKPCHGWLAARVAILEAEQKRGMPFPIKTCPWEFSAPDGATT